MSSFETIESKNKRLTHFLTNEISPTNIIKSVFSQFEEKSFYFIFSFALKTENSSKLLPKSFFTDWAKLKDEEETKGKGAFEVYSRNSDSNEIFLENIYKTIRRKSLFLANKVDNIKNLDGETINSYSLFSYLDVASYKLNNGSIKDFYMYFDTPFSNKTSVDTFYVNCYDNADNSPDNIFSYDAPFTCYKEQHDETYPQLRYFINDIYSKQSLVTAVNNNEKIADIVLEIIDNIQANSKNYRYCIYRMIFAVAKLYCLTLFLNKNVYDNNRRKENGYFASINNDWYEAFPDEVLDNILRDNKQSFYFSQQEAFLNKFKEGINKYCQRNSRTEFILKLVLSEYYCAEFSSMEMKNRSLSALIVSTDEALSTYKNILTTSIFVDYYKLLDYYSELEHEIKNEPNKFSQDENDYIHELKSMLNPLISYDVTSFSYKKNILILTGKPASIYYLKNQIKDKQISTEILAEDHNIGIKNICEKLNIPLIV